MNILAINGSPKGRHGNTEVLIQAFLRGASTKDDVVKTVYLAEKHIEHCSGCFTCWTKTPGVCRHHDDMAQILEDGLDTDILVLGSPLYIYNFTGLMKDFMDRILPMAQPFIDVHDGTSSHPGRHKGFTPKAIVLVSNSGFPEPTHFDGMKQVFRQSFGEASSMICCAGGPLLTNRELQHTVSWYTDAVMNAGQQVAMNGVISSDTQSVLDRPLVADAAAYADRVNHYWQTLGLERI